MPEPHPTHPIDLTPHDPVTRRRFLAISLAGTACGLAPVTPAFAQPTPSPPATQPSSQPATAPASQPAAQPPRVPTVYTAFLHGNQPNVWPLGIQRVRVAYPSTLWPGQDADRSRPPRQQVVDRIAHARPAHRPLILNIEHWPTRTKNQARYTVERFRQTIQSFRQANPDLRIGVYSIVPHRAYWPYQRHPKHIERIRLAERNGWLAPLADLLDFVCPSLYAFYNKPDRWEVYARGMLDAAHAYGKPVYPFLWHEFHNGGNPQQRTERLPLPFWERCLNLVADHAQGMILWGGFRQQWDPNADWWFAVEQMLAERLMARRRAGRAEPAAP
ncbi:MAG: hypothetical protein AAF797_12990 [Planctomycetota bacterium]